MSVGDFQHWEIRDHEDYFMEDDKVEPSTNAPLATAAVANAIKNKNELRIAIYGQELLAERAEAAKFLGDIWRSTRSIR